MTCQELVELVAAYLEGDLDDEQRAAFEEHLRLCPGCEAYLVQYRRTIDLLGELPERTISPAARERLLAAFTDWSRGGPA